MARKNIVFIDFIGFILFALLRSLFLLLPRRCCLQTGQALGLLFFYLDGKHRRLALANLDRAFGRAWPSCRLRQIAKDSFRHFGRMTADNLKWLALPESARLRLLVIEGEENVRQALQEGRGVLIFSAHFGNWEVAALAVARLARLSVVARPLDNPLVERELGRFRKSLGTTVIYKQQAAKTILKALRRNEIVAILIDQNVLRREAVFVDFFGVPAATTPAPASFFLRTGSPIIPVFCYPTPSLAYHVKIGKPLAVELSGEGGEDVLKITRHSTKMIETEIRGHPSLWFWFHNRWKTRPEGEVAGPAAAERDKGNRRTWP